MWSSKLKLAFLVLIVSQISVEGATGLALKSAESNGRPIVDDVATEQGWTKAQKQENIVSEISVALNQNTGPEQNGDLDTGIKRKDSGVDDGLAGEQGSRVDTRKDGSHTVKLKSTGRSRHRRSHLKKMLESMRKQKRRREHEKNLIRHRLYLFQKPEVEHKTVSTSNSASIQDIVSYFKGVGRRIKAFFTRYPVAIQETGEPDTAFNEELTSQDESDAVAQEIEAVMQEIILQSMVKGVSKRSTHEQELISQILDGMNRYVHVTYNMEEVDQDKVAKNKASKIESKDLGVVVPDKNSLPKLPTHTTTLTLSYTASSEDIPTVIPSIVTTLIQDME